MVLSVEDKLAVLGCKYAPTFYFPVIGLFELCIVLVLVLMVMIFRDLERRIVEAEMDLTLAKSQGYLKNNLQQKVSSSGPFLAVIGVYTGFGSRLKRNGFRGSWMPKGKLRFLMEIMQIYNAFLL